MSASADLNENFIKACRDGDLPKFNELLDIADVNYVSESVHGIKYTPLGIAIVFNHEIIAHKLLDHVRIDVNKKTCESTALHYACLRNSVSLIEAICAKPGVKMNEKDYLNSGVTPLMVAVKHKHVEAVRKLVKYKDVDLDPLDSEGHSLEFLVRRVENSRNAEILYIIESARQARGTDTVDGASGGVLDWLGFGWLSESSKKKEEDELEKKRRKELHEKELFELQRIKEEEEIKKRKIIEKSVNSVLDLLERKKEELANKEMVLKELKLIHSNERKELEEEYISKQRVLEDKQKEEAEKLASEKTKLKSELAQLEHQLEDIMSRDTKSESDNSLPCPECPVCLEMLMPPIRIMQCSNGHLVCEECESKPELTCCPTCRQSFTGRATAMEQHLSTLFT